MIRSLHYHGSIDRKMRDQLTLKDGMGIQISIVVYREITMITHQYVVNFKLMIISTKNHGFIAFEIFLESNDYEINSIGERTH